jgi:hypothetical protein
VAGPERTRTRRVRAVAKLCENPLIRMLAVIIAIAAGIRLIYELLKPVMLYLLVAVLFLAVVRLVSWYRGRW